MAKGGILRIPPPQVRKFEKIPPIEQIHQKSCKIARKAREITKTCDISSKKSSKIEVFWGEIATFLENV